jgi:hypothetical protein
MICALPCSITIRIPGPRLLKISPPRKRIGLWKQIRFSLESLPPTGGRFPTPLLLRS